MSKADIEPFNNRYM